MDLNEALNKAAIKVSIKSGVNPEIFNVESPIVENSIVSSFLDLNPLNLNTKQSEKLVDIQNWLDEQSQDEFEKVSILKDIRHKLKSTSALDTELDKIHKYIKFRSLSKQYDAQAKAMEQ